MPDMRGRKHGTSTPPRPRHSNDGPAEFAAGVFDAEASPRSQPPVSGVDQNQGEHIGFDDIVSGHCELQVIPAVIRRAYRQGRQGPSREGCARTSRPKSSSSPWEFRR